MFRPNISVYCRNEKIAALVRAYAKQLNSELVPTAQEAVETEIKEPLYDVFPAMILPLIDEWKQYQQYPWVFNNARKRLVEEHLNEQVPLSVIKKYVDEQLQHIDL